MRTGPPQMQAADFQPKDMAIARSLRQEMKKAGLFSVRWLNMVKFGDLELMKPLKLNSSKMSGSMVRRFPRADIHYMPLPLKINGPLLLIKKQIHGVILNIIKKKTF